MYEELERWVSSYVHPRYGLIRSIREVSKLPNFPSIYRIVASSADPVVISESAEFNKSARSYTGFGHSIDFEKACWMAIGESIERYAAALYNPAVNIVATAKELGSVEYMDEMILQTTPLMPDMKLQFDKYSPHTKRSWTSAYNHDAGCEAWMPSEILWFGVQSSIDGEKIGQSSSNGIGAGRTYHHALCSGILELIERDAIMTNWFLDKPWKRIDLTADLEENIPDGLSAYCSDNDVEIIYFYLQTEFRIPTILCVMYSERYSVVALGASASISPGKAVNKASYEALMIFSDQFEKQAHGYEIPELNQFKRFGDHASYYRDEKRSREVRQIFGNCNNFSFADVPSIDSDINNMIAYWKIICDELHSWGYSAISTDLSSSDIKDASFRVARVFVPGLQPLLFGPVIPGDDRRLKNYLRNLKHPPTEIRKVVHPFP